MGPFSLLFASTLAICVIPATLATPFGHSDAPEILARSYENCNSEEQTFLGSSLVEAKNQAKEVLRQIDDTKALPAVFTRYFNASDATNVSGKFQSLLDDLEHERPYVCIGGDEQGCGDGAAAMWDPNNERVLICPLFFRTYPEKHDCSVWGSTRGEIILHELTHALFHTNDKGDGNCMVHAELKLSPSEALNSAYSYECLCEDLHYEAMCPTSIRIPR